jgi:5-methyltetrahydropteroyltriglutamate--homocysteine methyltransferase
MTNAYPKLPRARGEKNLRNAINRFEKGGITANELESIYIETIKRVIRYQNEAGLDLVTDGMIRWDDPLVNFARGVKNLERGGLLRYFDTNTYYRRSVVSGQLQFERSSLTDDYKLAAESSQAPVKAVLPGPYTFANMVEDNFYFDRHKLIAAISEILCEEMKALSRAGCEVVQFEEPFLLSHPEDVAFASEYFNQVAACFENEIWLCFYFGGFAKISARADAFNAHVICADVVSHPGDFESLLHLNSGKKLCLGLLDARDIRMENADRTVARMNEAAKTVKGEDFYISTSCSLEFLPPLEAYDKLMLLGNLKETFNREGSHA